MTVLSLLLIFETINQCSHLILHYIKANIMYLKFVCVLFLCGQQEYTARITSVKVWQRQVIQHTKIWLFALKLDHANAKK
jgi:hypothetical protein